MVSKKFSKKYSEKILKEAGVTIGGDKPWDITVHNEDFYNRILSQGSLGLGESYMDGWWDVPDLSEFFNRVLRAGLGRVDVFTSQSPLFKFTQGILNPQKGKKSFKVAEEHYDIGNDIYKAMLDPRMLYTCGYWKNAKNLNEAQTDKLKLTCEKMNLEPGMKICEIGSGWGGFLKYAAENYGVEADGLTISREQYDYSTDLCKDLPVNIIFEKYQDYDAKEKYDRILIMGMIEHVGHKNYRLIMQKAYDLLKPGGMLLLHTIGRNLSKNVGEPWIAKHIFPNSMIPSQRQLSRAYEGLFVLEDLHNFGSDYDSTLMAWFDNFEQRWSDLEPQYGSKKDGKFYRMWKYYLLACAGLFRSRENQLWQMVLSKGGVSGGYTAIR